MAEYKKQSGFGKADDGADAKAADGSADAKADAPAATTPETAEAIDAEVDDETVEDLARGKSGRRRWP